MVKYIAFLRGINVGGNKIIKMEDLKRIFESLGFTNVKTVLASGNVLFEATTNVTSEVIEEKLKNKFGFVVGVILRTIEEIKELIALDPFKDMTVTPNTRLYVTFLEKIKNKPTDYPPDFTIVKITTREVCSVLIVSKNKRSVDLMASLEKELGKKITTRNWNTVLKMVN